MAKAYAPILKKIFSSKRIKKIESEIEKLGKRPRIIKKAEEDAYLINEFNKTFMVHNKRGAPSQKPKKRGRPKDKGL